MSKSNQKAKKKAKKYAGITNDHNASYFFEKNEGKQIGINNDQQIKKLRIGHKRECIYDPNNRYSTLKCHSIANIKSAGYRLFQRVVKLAYKLDV